VLHLRHQITPRKSRPTRLDDVFGTHNLAAYAAFALDKAVASLRRLWGNPLRSFAVFSRRHLESSDVYG
jgi:hypothetical protein